MVFYGYNCNLHYICSKIIDLKYWSLLSNYRSKIDRPIMYFLKTGFKNIFKQTFSYLKKH